ncbi:unnamed protein product [Allacma fusca]|uniref:Uncharacterized protein n=1 Tax=Allacma fusca TaxID=39272 RepID=A0A8J2NYB6_9HEXA|nr:unnamed protein product [Allacma fusca]
MVTQIVKVTDEVTNFFYSEIHKLGMIKGNCVGTFIGVLIGNIYKDSYFSSCFCSECPPTPDGAQEFFCPKPAPDGRWLCVDDHELCDGVKHCPNADDESPLVCMFYKADISLPPFL